MTIFASDTFTDTNGTDIAAHDPNWTVVPGNSGTFRISDANRLRGNSTTAASYYYNVAPSSANYTVQSLLYVVATGATQRTGVAGRCSSSANTLYFARLDGTNGWQLFKRVSGSATQLGSSVSQTISAGDSWTLKLDMSGTTIKCVVDGVDKISQTDSAIAGPGFPGVVNSSGTAPSNTLGYHLDNWQAEEAGGNVTVSGKQVIAASDSIPTTTILGSITTSAKLAASKVVAIATNISVAGGSGATIINKLGVAVSQAVVGTIIFGAKTVSSIITSTKSIIIPTNVFIHTLGAAPTIFQRINFLRRFIGRR
jgi:hypothetical protein